MRQLHFKGGCGKQLAYLEKSRQDNPVCLFALNADDVFKRVHLDVTGVEARQNFCNQEAIAKVSVSRCVVALTYGRRSVYAQRQWRESVWARVRSGAGQQRSSFGALLAVRVMSKCAGPLISCRNKPQTHLLMFLTGKLRSRLSSQRRTSRGNVVSVDICWLLALQQLLHVLCVCMPSGQGINQMAAGYIAIYSTQSKLPVKHGQT